MSHFQQKPFKICVVGPVNCGKTLLCKALADQTINFDEYHPTAGCRIQELDRVISNQRYTVQLWDCSGNPQFESLWPVMNRSIDAVLLCYESRQQANQEKDLERLYVKFAQPSKLNVSQCLIVGIDIDGAGFGPGLQGKLQRLQTVDVDLSRTGMEGGSATRAMAALDKLLEGAFKARQKAAASG